MERNAANIYPFLKRWNARCKAGCINTLVAIFLVGCSVESKLNRSYKGKSFTNVMDTMGAPTTVENRIGGGTIRSYVSKKMLKPAPINTGQFQYDKFESPKVMQTIVTSFIVDSSGKVLEITYSNEYSR